MDDFIDLMVEFGFPLSIYWNHYGSSMQGTGMHDALAECTCAEGTCTKDTCDAGAFIDYPEYMVEKVYREPSFANLCDRYHVCWYGGHFFDTLLFNGEGTKLLSKASRFDRVDGEEIFTNPELSDDLSYINLEPNRMYLTKTTGIGEEHHILMLTDDTNMYLLNTVGGVMDRMGITRTPLSRARKLLSRVRVGDAQAYKALTTFDGRDGDAPLKIWVIDRPLRLPTLEETVTFAEGIAEIQENAHIRKQVDELIVNMSKWRGNPVMLSRPPLLGT